MSARRNCADRRTWSMAVRTVSGRGGPRRGSRTSRGWPSAASGARGSRSGGSSRGCAGRRAGARSSAAARRRGARSGGGGRPGRPSSRARPGPRRRIRRLVGDDEDAQDATSVFNGRRRCCAGSERLDERERDPRIAEYVVQHEGLPGPVTVDRHRAVANPSRRPRRASSGTPKPGGVSTSERVSGSQSRTSISSPRGRRR